MSNVIEINFKKSEEPPETMTDLIRKAFGYMSQQDALDHVVMIMDLVAKKCKTTDADLLRMIIAARSGELD